MRLGSFKRMMKKEFENNYNENRIVKKEKTKWDLNTKLIPFYAMVSIVFVLFLSLGIKLLVGSPKENTKNIPSLDSYFEELNPMSEDEFEYSVPSVRVGMYDLSKDSEIVLFPISNIATQSSNAYDFYDKREEKGDIVKFDGHYFYYLYDQNLVIYNLKGDLVTSKELDGPFELMLVYKDLIILYSFDCGLHIYSFDDFNLVKTIVGKIVDVKLYGNKLYVVSASQFERGINFDFFYSKTEFKKEFFYAFTCINLDTIESEKRIIAASSYSICYIDQDYVICVDYVENNKNSYKSYAMVFDNDLCPIGTFIFNGVLGNENGISVYDNYLRIVSITNGIVFEDEPLTEESQNRTEDCTINLSIFDIENKKMSASELFDLKIFTDVSFYKNNCYIGSLISDVSYDIDFNNMNDIKLISNEKYYDCLKTFTAAGKEYGLCVDHDFDGGEYNIYVVDKDEDEEIARYTFLIRPIIVFDCCLFYQQGNVLYFGMSTMGEYKVLRIDVTDESVIVEFMENSIDSLTKAIVYRGKIYIPQLDHLIIEEF